MFLQRPRICVEQKRILISLGERSSIFKDVQSCKDVKMPSVPVVSCVNLFCRACGFCFLNFFIYEAKEISLKDNYYF